MKKLLILVMIMLFATMLTSCGTSKITQMTADELVNKLKYTNLPISYVVVYTSETDKNHLLGKPNQYISKINFADSRLKQVEGLDPNGGSIETFSNVDDLTARKNYLEAAYKSMPAFTEYLFINGKYLLRLSKDLTVEQINEYKEIFMKLK